MRFGFHVSIAGGFDRVFARAAEVECETMQLFTGNPRGWTKRPLDSDEASRFRERLRSSSVSPVFAHSAYLPNLAASDRPLARRTVSALVGEAERCRELGIGYLITHAGRSLGSRAATGLRRAATAVDRVLDRAPASVKLLIENTAGMGSEVGHDFEQLAELLGQVEQSDRVGVVLDTAHLHAAGYDLTGRPGVDRTVREFDRVVGMGRLHLLHLNDSKSERGGWLDRHWHIGQGRIGRAGFRAVVNHPLLRHLPGIMETPRSGPADDLDNLRTVRRLVK
ncbi:deoxyribonuclease IV [candidate division WOR-3 bacterium]|nr:deoxyribonuclease IV [candidate division WOR-3 bacterium]